MMDNKGNPLTVSLIGYYTDMFFKNHNIAALPFCNIINICSE